MSELGTVNDNNRHSHINVHTEQDTQSPLLNKNEIPHKHKDVLEGLGKRPTSKGQTSATHATMHRCHQEVKEKLVELEKKCIITKETVPNDGLAAW